MRNKNDKILQSLGRMEPVDGNREAEEIQKRLNEGRDKFNQLVGGICKSVMQISALDLAMGDSTDKMGHISNTVKSISETVVRASQMTEENMNEVVNAHEGFAESIAQVSSALACSKARKLRRKSDGRQE